ncbi:zinc carboxypeptidase A 1-like isoform X2 [Zerene cesonia]|uniref:zinc carboxypeptidase A 1-like isoform X2 n=1 Tax=Zerene cesonia TaxID=33412 RepID=UPI0018E50D7A|nr:zinc carboxypeptidase A 1-like isoform X2 [Zerene cesonia]
MESWLRALVLVAAAAAVLGTPLVNDLEPGKDVETTEDPVNANTDELAAKNVDEIKEEIPKIIQRAAADDKDDKVDYTGAQVWKVSTENSGVRLILGRLRRRNLIATWSGNHSYVDVLVKSNAVENVTKVFQRENIDFSVVIDDLQKRINEENPPLDQNEIELQDRRGHRMTWKQYHRIEDIHGFLDYLAKTYPAIVSVKSIGKSYEGRDLKVLRISNGQKTNKAVFIDGGIHAREWISPATVTFLINQIAENFDEESDEIKNIDWYFLPVVNPDGYEYTHKADRLWRKNRKPTIGTRQCVGTDLNRNFG